MSVRACIVGIAAAAALAAGNAPAFAWEQLDLGTNSSGQPTYAPQGQGNGQLQFEGLPGVQLNRGQQAVDSNCSQSSYRSNNFRDFGRSGTMTECNFGKFSFRSYSSDGANGISGYNPFPVPGPLQQAGPPPGSGGNAPVRRW